MPSAALIDGLPLQSRDSEHVPAEHLWVVAAAYRVNPLEPRPWPLGGANLITADGPGCYFCEREYTPELAALPCPGEPDDQPA